MANDKHETMLAHMAIGEAVCQLVRESGLMVPRQKPGRKAEPAPKVQAKPVPAKVNAKAAKPKAEREVEAEEPEDEDEDDSEE